MCVKALCGRHQHMELLAAPGKPRKRAEKRIPTFGGSRWHEASRGTGGFRGIIQFIGSTVYRSQTGRNRKHKTAIMFTPRTPRPLFILLLPVGMLSFPFIGIGQKVNLYPLPDYETSLRQVTLTSQRSSIGPVTRPAERIGFFSGEIKRTLATLWKKRLPIFGKG